LTSHGLTEEPFLTSAFHHAVVRFAARHHPDPRLDGREWPPGGTCSRPSLVSSIGVRWPAGQPGGESRRQPGWGSRGSPKRVSRRRAEPVYSHNATAQCGPSGTETSRKPMDPSLLACEARNRSKRRCLTMRSSLPARPFAGLAGLQ
jgi:hypothetical protein